MRVCNWYTSEQETKGQREMEWTACARHNDACACFWSRSYEGERWTRLCKLNSDNKTAGQSELDELRRMVHKSWWDVSRDSQPVKRRVMKRDKCDEIKRHDPWQRLGVHVIEWSRTGNKGVVRDRHNLDDVKQIRRWGSRSIKRERERDVLVDHTIMLWWWWWQR